MAFIGNNPGLALQPVDRTGAPTVYPGPRGPSSSAYIAPDETWMIQR